MNSSIRRITRRKTKAIRSGMELLTRLPYSTLFEIWAGLMFLFGVAYYFTGYIQAGGHSPVPLGEIGTLQRFGNSLYFSIITGTTIGYGDITPHGISKFFTSLQSISAIFIFAIFVTKLVSHQQELTLNEVHRMSFEGIFHNTREGLFLCRKDFDHAIHEAQKHKTLAWETWENVTTAYQHLGTLLGDIPDFYANSTHQYTIDEKRERLLLEAVHRTLHRLNQMLDTLSKHEIDWVSHEASLNELRDLVRIISEATPRWQERSPYGSTEAFQDILQMNERVHLKMLQAIPAE